MNQALDVDAYLKLGGSQSSANTNTQAAHAATPDNRLAAATLLASVWPPDGQGRHLLQMALAGALVHARWSDVDATTFLCTVCRLAGNEDPDKRAKSVREARAKAKTKQPYTGFPTMEEKLGPEVVSQAKALLGITDFVDGSALNGFQDPDDPLNVVSPGNKQKITFQEVGYYLSQTTDWAGVFRFNVLTRRHVAVRPPFPMRMEGGLLSEGDIGKVRDWFAVKGLQASKHDIVDNISKICESPGRSYNPFVEYLDSLPPVSGNLAMVHMTILKVSDPLASALFTKTLVAAVRRARAAPGIGEKQQMVDHQGVLVLSGAQGVGKGRLVKILAGEWYATADISRLKDKDTTIKLQGSVLVELEEMSTSGAADRDVLKRFLSASDDFERPAYGHGAERVARTYALIATTNEAKLEDPTGNRRFWPIILTPGTYIDHEAATQLRDALWSEANALAATDYDHGLDSKQKAMCAEVAATLEVEDSNREAIIDALCGHEYATTRYIYDHVTKGTKKDDLVPWHFARSAGEVLHSLGCISVVHDATRKWKVPANVMLLKVSEEGAAYRSRLEVMAGLKLVTRN